MIPPLPESLGDSEHQRLARFAKCVLAVPKSEILPAEEVLAKLEAEKQKVDAKLAEVRRELVKRKGANPSGPIPEDCFLVGLSGRALHTFTSSIDAAPSVVCLHFGDSLVERFGVMTGNFIESGSDNEFSGLINETPPKLFNGS
jgi:hypothetical protein